MAKRLTIKNYTNAELGIMLEPWLDREDLQPNESVEIAGDVLDDGDLVIDVHGENFISLWTPPHCTLSKIK